MVVMAMRVRYEGIGENTMEDENDVRDIGKNNRYTDGQIPDERSASATDEIEHRQSSSRNNTRLMCVPHLCVPRFRHVQLERENQ